MATSGVVATRRRVAGTVLALLLASAAPALAAEANLSGTWTFVAKRSDDIRGKIVDSAGLDSTEKGPRKGGPREWIRPWLLAQAALPERPVLTIEHGASEFETAVGDDVRLYYFARESVRQEEGGVRRRASVRRQAGQVIVEERAEKGPGQITEIYALQPDGRTLFVVWRLEHKDLRGPLDLRLVFEKSPP
jgi:hypothetical protein